MTGERTSCVLVLTLLAACGTRAEPPGPRVADPVAAALCPLAMAATQTYADVDALAVQAGQAQKDVLSQSFDPKYRPLTSAAFALQGAASSLVNINTQLPAAQRGAFASSEPFRTYRQRLEQAQQQLRDACDL